jgi:hypothetical protein
LKLTDVVPQATVAGARFTGLPKAEQTTIDLEHVAVIALLVTSHLAVLVPVL